MRLLAIKKKKKLRGFELNASSKVMQELLNYHSSPDLDDFTSLPFTKGRSEKEIKINRGVSKAIQAIQAYGNKWTNNHFPLLNNWPFFFYLKVFP